MTSVQDDLEGRGHTDDEDDGVDEDGAAHDEPLLSPKAESVVGDTEAPSAVEPSTDAPSAPTSADSPKAQSPVAVLPGTTSAVDQQPEVTPPVSPPTASPAPTIIIACKHSTADLLAMLPPLLWAIIAFLLIVFFHLYFREQNKWAAVNDFTRQTAVRLREENWLLAMLGSETGLLRRGLFSTERLLGVDKALLG